VTHADAIRDAERAALDSMMTWHGLGDRPFSRAVMHKCAAKLEALRAETCHDCGGTAFVDSFGPPHERQRPIPHTAYRHRKSACPSCTNGRKVAGESVGPGMPDRAQDGPATEPYGESK
jgi:hypothetical protein